MADEPPSDSHPHMGPCAACGELGHLWEVDGSRSFLCITHAPPNEAPSDSWICDECEHSITGLDAISTDHGPWCSLHPGNVDG